MISVLLHEYGHFCQLKDEFGGYLDGICYTHELHEDWVSKRIELTEREIKMACGTMLAVEYDAEMRAIKLGEALCVDNFDAAYHLQDARSYMAAIKWSFNERKDWTKRPSWKLYPAKRLSSEELFAPLTAKENEILKGIKY